MRLRSLIVFLVSFHSVIAAAQESARTSTAVVPVVGNVVGAGTTHWRTNVEIVNDTGGNADVALELPNTPEQPVIVLSLAPGEVQRFGDITAQAFGIDHVLSPLRITTSGRRSVTVRAQVYAEYGGEFSPMQVITTYVTPQYAPIRALDGLAFNDTQRTNIGLVNFGATEAEFVLALQRIPGRNLAVTRRRVPSGQMFHEAIQSIFPLITEGDGFSVVIESIAPETYVYGSVIESENQAARFIAPRVAVR
ncbi:MAG: hypothetical protein ACTHQM_08335 [Thermoanaerobaculia bacterium]